jgi:hypothetical protein
MRKYLFSRHLLFLYLSVMFSSALIAKQTAEWEKLKTTVVGTSIISSDFMNYSWLNDIQPDGIFDEGCEINSFPFAETFEADSGTRACWINEYISGSFDWTYRAGTSAGGPVTTANNGALNASFSQASFTANKTRLVSPKFNFTGKEDGILKFWYANPAWGSDQSELRVFYKTSIDGTWTLIPNATYTTSVTVWTEITLTLPNSSGNADYYFAFEGTNDYSRGIGVDDVSVTATNMPAGCLTSPWGQYPDETFTPNCIGYLETIVADAYAGEYSRVNLIAGTTYTFASERATDVVTISNAAGTTVLKAGIGSTNYTAATTGVVRFYLHNNEACASSTILRAKFVGCGTITTITPPAYACVKGDGIIGEMQDGYGVNPTSVYRVADDFTVDPGYTLNVREITADVLTSSNVNNAVLNIRANNNGSPGAILHTVTMAPTTSTLHNGGYGLKGYHLTFTLATPILLGEGTYWFQPTFTNANNSTVYWQVNYDGITGGYAQFSGDSGSTWGEDEDVTAHGVFFVAGECGCSATEVPYTQDFSSAVVPGMPECTTVVNAGTGNNWVTYEGNGYGFTGKHLRYRWNTNNAANSWFFTQGINLTAGTEYSISYDYGGTGASLPEKMKVSYGMEPTVAGMTQLIEDHPSIVNSTPNTHTETFTPSATGVYYFGFNVYSDADEFYLHLDNINIDFAPENPVDGCLNTPFGAWPTGARTPNCTGYPSLITDEGYFGEYSIINVVAGTEYTFSTDVETAYITIANAAGNTILTAGEGSVTWTSDVTGTIRFITHENAECEFSESIVARYVTCGEIYVFDAPDYECFQGDGAMSDLENGYGIQTTGAFRVADDFVVEADTEFTLRQITLSLLSTTDVTNAQVKIHADNAGLPGEVLNTIDLTPTTNVIFGSAFGFNAHRVEFALTTPEVLTEGKYWINVTTTNATYWVVSSNVSHESLVALSSNSGTSWSLDTDGMRAIMYVEGDCNAIEEPVDGCLEAENGQYPSATFTPACSGSPEAVTTLAWTGEYSVVSVTAGTEYTFSSSIATDFVTISDEAGETVYASGTSSVTWTATATENVRFYLHLDDECDWSASGLRSRIVQCGTILPPPSNDDCADAIAVSCGDSVSGSTTFATNSGGNAAADVFYKFTGTGDAQMVTLSLCESSYDTYLRVFTDCTLSTEVAFNDDACGLQSELTFLSDGTSTYYIMIEGFSSNAGNYVLNVSCETPVAYDPCAPVHTGVATNGVGFVNNGAEHYVAANDFNVMADTQFEVSKFIIDVVTLGGEPTTFDLTFYEGETAVGAEFGESIEGLTPTAITPNGTFGTTGYPVYTVELTLPTTVIFPATATAAKKYWVGMSGYPTANNNTVYWVSSAYTMTDTLPTYQSDNGGAAWYLFDPAVEGNMSIVGECATLGLQDMSNYEFAYYPNPVNDVLNITSQKGVQSVEVFNLAGQQIMKNAKVSNGQINVSALTAGTYVFRVKLEGGQIETFKIIKK